MTVGNTQRLFLGTVDGQYYAPRLRAQPCSEPRTPCLTLSQAKLSKWVPPKWHDHAVYTIVRTQRKPKPILS